MVVVFLVFVDVLLLVLVEVIVVVEVIVLFVMVFVLVKIVFVVVEEVEVDEFGGIEVLGFFIIWFLKEGIFGEVVLFVFVVRFW